MTIPTKNKTVIKGCYNKGEEQFIADYFIRYGCDLKSVKPESL